MPKLTGKLGSWELDHVHMWKERRARIRAERRPWIEPETRIATIGSCFAEELAAALSRTALHGGMHPGGLFYNSLAIRQEFERIAGEWTDYDAIEPWQVPGGFIHPLKSYRALHPTRDALAAWRDELDERAASLFTTAEVVVVTLGLIEAWIDPKTGAALRQIPHPAVFESRPARFTRQTVAEIEDDLEAIHAIVARWGARLVVTVSPIPLHATMTPLDVRVANSESKARIRAAVSQFVERHPEVGYFHSYEIVTTAEQPSEFLLEDGRHVRRPAVDWIVRNFLETFATEELALPEVDTTWLSEPSQTAARPVEPRAKRLRRRLSEMLRRSAR